MIKRNKMLPLPLGRLHLPFPSIPLCIDIGVGRFIILGGGGGGGKVYNIGGQVGGLNSQQALDVVTTSY